MSHEHDEISDELLSAWLDGEAGKRTAEVRDYVASHPAAQARVRELERASGELKALVDRGVGEVEPLVALAKIRQRIQTNADASLGARLTRGWNDLWAFHRKALAGVAAAAALGALCAPGVMWLFRTSSGRDAPTVASVVVESLEVGENAKAVVMQGDSGSTTLIWVSATGNGSDAEEQ